MPLEKLNCTLMPLGRRSGQKGAEISSSAGFRIFLARIQAVFSRRKFADHGSQPPARFSRLIDVGLDSSLFRRLTTPPTASLRPFACAKKNLNLLCWEPFCLSFAPWIDRSRSPAGDSSLCRPFRSLRCRDCNAAFRFRHPWRHLVNISFSFLP